MEKKNKWMETMMDKLDTDEEGVREFMRAAGAKSRRNTGGKGGFAHIKKNDPDRFKKIASDGGKKSKRG